MNKTTFTARIEIPGLSEYGIMEFEVTGENLFYKLNPLYKESEEPIQRLKDIFFNQSWMARNPKNQQVVDWVKSIFKEKNLNLPL